MARGALSSKGKYIFPIDNDDMFMDKDVFYSVIKVAKKGDFDLLLIERIFSSLIPSAYNSNYKKTLFKKERIPNLVLFQPELSYFPINVKDGNLNLVEVVLNGKCIKTKIYKQALNKLGEERYSRYMLSHEDVVATIILFNTAESFKFVGKYGIFHIQRSESVSWGHKNNEVKNLYNIYMIDIAIDFTKEAKENQKLLVYLIIFTLNMPELHKTFNSNEYFRKILISCLDRVLKSKFISNEDKNIITKRGKKLEFLKYPF